MLRQSFATAVFVFWLCCGQCDAEILPSFILDFSAWKATDIVVIDPDGRVLETWKGGLIEGDRLPIATWLLTQAADVKHDSWERQEIVAPKDRVSRVGGQRRVLFLIRHSEKEVHDTSAWKAASIGHHLDTAAVWIEAEKAFAIQQWMNPGPTLMRPLGFTPTELKNEVGRLAKQQQALRAARKEVDPYARAKNIVPFIEEKNYLARNETFEALKECGDAAWPVIKPLILDKGKVLLHSHLVHLLDKVGRIEAVPVIEEIIAEEMTYWDSLSEEEQRAGSFNPPMHPHYSRLSACLFVLKRSDYHDSKGLVAKLRTKWDADPNLRHLGGAGRNGRSPILTYADEILQSK